MIIRFAVTNNAGRVIPMMCLSKYSKQMMRILGELEIDLTYDEIIKQNATRILPNRKNCVILDDNMYGLPETDVIEFVDCLYDNIKDAPYLDLDPERYTFTKKELDGFHYIHWKRIPINIDYEQPFW